MTGTRRLVRALACASIIGVLFAVATLVDAESELGWQPQRTWVFVVGVLHWKHTEMFGSFPEKKRRDSELVDFFKKAGVPTSQVVYLKDKDATQETIDSEFAAQLKKPRPGDLLVLYYAGHGYKPEARDDTFLASYDTDGNEVPGWSVNAVPDAIDEHPNVTKVVWLIDCCYSGQAVDALRAHKHKAAYACATSSSASESSTGHWTFTEAFLDSIRGSPYPDLNHDGRTTLAEFASYVDRDMSLAEEQESRFATTGNFDKDMVLASAPPLDNPRFGERVKVKAEGDWYVARIIGINGSKFTVHFIGYDKSDDLVVDESAMRTINPTQYAIGSKVDVMWKKKWYPAVVLKVKDGVHYIHYDGYEAKWDEWVSSKRIRKSTAG